MTSPAFAKLPTVDRRKTVAELHEYQRGKCYICEDTVDLAQPVDVDHIRALDRGGLDSRNNWGLTHEHCNRAKGNRDLDLQRYLMRFRKIRQAHPGGEATFTVAVALASHGGAQRETTGRIEREAEKGEFFATTWNTAGNVTTLKTPIHVDTNNSGVRSFTSLVPIENVFHDSEINPRSIVDLEPFIEEFYRGNPQLLPSLAHLSLDGSDAGRGRILLFDGQHKAAAQLFLGNRLLYLRVFMNPDIKLLRNTNFGAHTKLAQIHFPMAIQDKVGHDLLLPALQDFLQNSSIEKVRLKESSIFRSLPKEERAEMRAHFQGYLRFRVVAAVGNSGTRFFDYVETVTARSKTRPLAYETVRKALFTNFLFLHETDEALALASEMRDLERDNLARLMGLFTSKVLVNQFDLSKGIHKLEDRLATDPSIRDPHLRAYRLCRQAPLIVLMKELRDAIAQLLALRRRYGNPGWREDQVFWAEIAEDDWAAIGKMLDLVVSHKVWIERNDAYARYLQDTRKGTWEAILVRGTFPGAEQPVYDPLNHSAFLRRGMP